jgi:hypothetical protein
LPRKLSPCSTFGPAARHHAPVAPSHGHGQGTSLYSQQYNGLGFCPFMRWLLATWYLQAGCLAVDYCTLLGQRTGWPAHELLLIMITRRELGRADVIVDSTNMAWPMSLPQSSRLHR